MKCDRVKKQEKAAVTCTSEAATDILSKHITYAVFTIPEHTVLPCCMLIKNAKQKQEDVSRIKCKTIAWRIIKLIHKL
jgi:hypothetical protein